MLYDVTTVGCRVVRPLHFAMCTFRGSESENRRNIDVAASKTAPNGLPRPRVSLRVRATLFAARGSRLATIMMAVNVHLRWI